MTRLLLIAMCLQSLGLAQHPFPRQIFTTFPHCFGDDHAVAAGHVRFTQDEHIAFLLTIIPNEKQEAAESAYRYWELASFSVDWFGGTKRVSLNYVKSHMPRAMLLEMRFPVDEHPMVEADSLAELLKAEKEYEDKTNESKVVGGIANSLLEKFIAKYNLGDMFTLDEDYGGATPTTCGKQDE